MNEERISKDTQEKIRMKLIFIKVNTNLNIIDNKCNEIDDILKAITSKE